MKDTFRQYYLMAFMSEMYKAVTMDKVNVKGYFVWSFMDVRTTRDWLMIQLVTSGA
jgi:beta-glucosidase/6-phospho-beta-glucosidase/beta-galactosidase